VPCSFRNPELRDVRRLTVTGFENWLLFYRDTEDRIDVIRVLHGARDIAAIFEEDT
jgi:toxin ParE1/3/4